MNRPAQRSWPAAPLWAAAAGLPWLAHAVVALAEAPDGWSTLSRASRLTMSADALLLSAAMMMLGAPLAAVAVTRRCRPAGGLLPGDGAPMHWRAAATCLGGAIAVFLLTSAALGIAASGTAIGTLQTIARSHATLGAALLAMAAVGSFCTAILRDPLDAAACSTGVALAAGVGILIAGPVVSDLPRVFIEFGLAASPVVATASAANIDLMRTDVLYHVSPIAHVQFEYPVWYVAAGVYALVALLCLAGAGGIARSRSLSERIIRS